LIMVSFHRQLDGEPLSELSGWPVFTPV